MTPDQALEFIREHGVVLVSANGPVPKMTETVAGEPVRGSWWGHPKGREIFAVFQVLEDSPDLLVCRLIENKLTYVHRRLWPAVIRTADRFPAERLARIRQEHTASGKHVNHTTPFPDWADAEALAQAKTLSEWDALTALGAWAYRQ